MKRVAIVFALALVASALGAQTIVAANAVILDWDLVTTLDNGTPVPAGDVISYQVLYGEQSTDAVIDGETSGPPYTLAFPSEGLFVVGVRTIRVTATSQRIESPINWSDVDVPEGSTPNPFFVSVYRAPSSPVGFRVTVP